MDSGILWYDRVTYPDILALMLDKQTMPQTWENWYETAQEKVETCPHLKKVDFDIGEFLAFCVRHGFRTDEQARQHYATLKVEDPAGVPVR